MAGSSRSEGYAPARPPRKKGSDAARPVRPRAHAPPIGQVEHLAPGLRVVTAPNAGPMTYTGTRSYIVGRGRVAVIDPGPDDPAHVAALVGALEPGERVEAILVTHAHRDHSSGGARRCARGSTRRSWRMAIRSAPAAPRWRGWRPRAASAAARGWTKALHPTVGSARAR